MIIVISSETDEHARATMTELDRLGVEHRLVDLSRFPNEMSLAVRYSCNGGSRFALTLGQEDVLELERVRSLWWRRPQPFEIDPRISRPSHQTFAYNESYEAFAGLWQTLDAFWVNHPTRDEVAARKLLQLKVAKSVGLPTPETLITNDSEEARSFIDFLKGRGVVCKAFSATPQEWRETRLVGDAELAVLENVRHAPVIFQEYIQADVDLRVTVVGNSVFPAAIHSQDTSYPIDFRMDMQSAKVEAAKLPDETLTRLRRLMNELGLIYGAIDMRRTPDGRHVFLEINPAGQWLFVEQRTGQPISATLARVLVNASPMGTA